jgi:uncharacterized membrane protein YbhN (UPF0104 family)
MLNRKYQFMNILIKKTYHLIIGCGFLFLIYFLLNNLNIDLILKFFSPVIILVWLAITLITRILLLEIFVQPIHLLGYPIRRVTAFWLGWMRSFFNQFIPFSGVALLAGYCKRCWGLDWGQIAALSSPLFLVALAINGTFATGAILINFQIIAPYGAPMGLISFAVTILALLMIIKGPRGLECMPIGIRSRLSSMEQTLKMFTGHRQLLARLTLCYSGIIILRCLRLWFLFIMATSLPINIKEILLLAAISDFAFLVPVIPGGIGLREGAMISAAWLLGDMNIEIVALVALMDRAFSIASVALMGMPAYLVLKRGTQRV